MNYELRYLHYLAGRESHLWDLVYVLCTCRYSRWGAYGQSKLANVLHANELARRLKVIISMHNLTYAASIYTYILLLD